jgi:nicotinamide riboside transporter PnuC
MFELIGTITTVIAVYGAWLNNRANKVCFLLWIISNTLSGGLHFHDGRFSLVVRDMIFLILAVLGYLKWSKTEKDDSNE